MKERITLDHELLSDIRQPEKQLPYEAYGVGAWIWGTAGSLMVKVVHGGQHISLYIIIIIMYSKLRSYKIKILNFQILYKIITLIK